MAHEKDDKGLSLTPEERAKYDAAFAALAATKRPGCACGELDQMPQAPPVPRIVEDLAALVSKMTGEDLRPTDRIGVVTIDPRDGAHTSEGCFKPVPGMRPSKRLEKDDACPGLCFKPGGDAWYFTEDLEKGMDTLLGSRHRYGFARFRSLDEARDFIKKEGAK